MDRQRIVCGPRRLCGTARPSGRQAISPGCNPSHPVDPTKDSAPEGMEVGDAHTDRIDTHIAANPLPSLMTILSFEDHRVPRRRAANRRLSLKATGRRPKMPPSCILDRQPGHPGGSLPPIPPRPPLTPRQPCTSPGVPTLSPPPCPGLLTRPQFRLTRNSQRKADYSPRPVRSPVRPPLQPLPTVSTPCHPETPLQSPTPLPDPSSRTT